MRTNKQGKLFAQKHSTKFVCKRKRTVLFLVQLYWRRAIACDQVQNILFAHIQINEGKYPHQNIQQNLHANANELLCSWSNFIDAVRLPVINQVQNILFDCTQINKAYYLHQSFNKLLGSLVDMIDSL